LYFAGVDIGSTMTKVVLIDKSSNLLSTIKGPTGAEHRQLANEVMQTMGHITFVIDVCLPLFDQVLATGVLPDHAKVDQAFGLGEKLH